MRKEDIKKSFDNIEPSHKATQKMLNRVLNHSGGNEKVFLKSLNLKRVIPAMAMVCVLTGSVLTYNFVSNRSFDAIEDNAESDFRDSVGSGDDLIGERGDIAFMKNQFQIGNKHYSILSASQKEEYSLPSKINESDIGDKVTTISTSVDESLRGSDVYKYIPAGGEAIVAVKRENEYELFKFFVFESYTINQDEDVDTYLKLHGINTADDIAKVQFIGYSEQAKIEGVLDIKGEISYTTAIEEFYNYYSVIKDSSERYFEKLYNYKTHTGEGPASGQIDKAPDYKYPTDGPAIEESDEPAEDLLSDEIVSDRGPTGMVDTGKSNFTEPSPGRAGDAMNNSVTIRIYNQKGIYFEAIYYPNLGFISRHEVSKEFGIFLKEYIGQ